MYGHGVFIIPYRDKSVSALPAQFSIGQCMRHLHLTAKKEYGLTGRPSMPLFNRIFEKDRPNLVKNFILTDAANRLVEVGE